MAASTDRWNHNIHHHSVVLDALGPNPGRVLDVGCGEGDLVAELAGRATSVVGLDRHGPTVAVAELQRRATETRGVAYVIGDLLDAPFPEAGFDAVVSVAALHHGPTTAGLRALADLVRPGGVLAVVGLARTRTPRDLAWDAAGVATHQVLRRRRTHHETSAPKVWPPPDSYGAVARVARVVLPGVTYRRHPLFRYSLVWRRPAEG
jgi:2-polyprenyl-3-methyl-5-hydroxy-6-metoxy-1,4-benzoquinol methylase